MAHNIIPLMSNIIEAIDGTENFGLLFKETKIPKKILKQKGDIEPDLRLSESTEEAGDITRHSRGRRFHGVKKNETEGCESTRLPNDLKTSEKNWRKGFVSKRLPYVRAIERNWWEEIDGSNGYHSDSERVSGSKVLTVGEKVEIPLFAPLEVALIASLEDVISLRILQQSAFKDEWSKTYDPKDTRGGA